MKMKKIKLGIIGMSEGNGHPYSWSAICNGFESNYMQECPFPVIPEYLSKEKYPDNFIKDAEVTHIWTQKREYSEHIAKAAKISNIVDNAIDMIGEVDGVLLARDDAENHYEMCKPFVEAGIMIYIDKPLAFDNYTAEKIYSLQRYEGQIFSCSAMRYAREIDDNIEKIKALGDITFISANTMKKWDTYSAHIIDPVLRILGDNIQIQSSMRINNSNTQGVFLETISGVGISLMAHKTSKNPITVDIYGTKGNISLKFEDTFYAFRGALIAFVKSIKQKRSLISEEHVKKLVGIIELGNA